MKYSWKKSSRKKCSRTLKEIFLNLERIFSNLERNLLEPWKKSSRTLKKIFSNLEKKSSRTLKEIFLKEVWENRKWRRSQNHIELISSLKGQSLIFSIFITRETYNIKYWIQMGWNIPTVWSCKPASPLKVPFPSSVTVFRSLFINFSMEKASIKKERNSRTICFHT